MRLITVNEYEEVYYIKCCTPVTALFVVFPNWMY